MIMFGAGSGAGASELFLLLILAEGQAFALGPIPWQLKQRTMRDKIKKYECKLLKFSMLHGE